MAAKTIKEELDICAYDGSEFFIQTTSIKGGRRDVKHEFANSDLQFIEDLGLQRRVWELKGFIAATFNSNGNILASYKENRDDLVTSLESGGRHTLIHPFYGELRDIVCRTFKLDENMDRLGEASIAVTFEESPVPRPLAADQPLLPAFFETDIAAPFLPVWLVEAISSIAKAIGAVLNFIDKVVAIVDDIVAFVNAVQGAIDNFIKIVEDVVANINAIISLPGEIAKAINNIVRAFDGIFASFIDTFSAMRSMFDIDFNFGFSQTKTALGRSDKKNSDVFSNTIKATALSYMYNSAAQVDFETVEQIQELTEDLESRYDQLLQNPGIDRNTLALLTDRRANTLSILSAAALTARKRTTVRTVLTTPRLTSYKYYNESDQGTLIADMNGLKVQELVGLVDILTP